MNAIQPVKMSAGTTDTDTLWKTFHEELYAFLRGRVASEAQAQDILQQAFLKAHTELESGARLEKPRAWLYQVARNLVHDASRYENKQRVLSDAAARELADRDAAHAEQDTFAVVARILPHFVARLEEPYRTALRLTELEGLSHQEAADQASVSLTCMKSRVRRARQQVHAALQQCCRFTLDARGHIMACEQRALPCSSRNC